MSTTIARHTGEQAATSTFHLVEAGLTGFTRIAAVIWRTIAELGTQRWSIGKELVEFLSNVHLKGEEFTRVKLVKIRGP
jgi:hypothetical protein